MRTRAIGMVIASFVGDSFALGSHWIYDTEKIAEQFGQIQDLLPPSPDGYHPNSKRGGFTHYGAQSLHLLEYLHRKHGRFDPKLYFADWSQQFEKYDGYMDRAMKTSLENFRDGRPETESGSASTDLGGVCRFSPLLYCRQDHTEIATEQAVAFTRLTHNSPVAQASARFLANSCHFLMQGDSLRESFSKSLDLGIGDIDLEMRLYATLERETGDVLNTVKELGQMCGAASALPGSVYTVLSYEQSLEDALIATVMAGGDSAARGMTVGMLLGAHLGPSSIPRRWLEGLTDGKRIQEMLDDLGNKS